MNFNLLGDSRSGETASLPDSIITSQPQSGGLWSLKDYPQVNMGNLGLYAGSTYQELAFFILQNFDFGISVNELKQVIDEAYADQWHNKDITPVKQIGNTNLHSLHLGYGPTFAFKNVALEFLPRLLQKLKRDEIINVIGASSGDTVNAAHSGVKGTNINSIFMLPENGPSYIQKLQALNGISDNPNAMTLLADYPFDPLQDIVKRINSPEFSEFKAENNITSFNSINIARILAQVVYYFRAYTELLKNGKIKNGDEVIYSVPTGNFGDALAGYYAKKMGLLIGKILIATNENDMLDKFFKTGIYEPPKENGKDFVFVSNAPSMDIAKSSNFERMLFDVCNYDSDQIRDFYDTLNKTGKFEVSKEILSKINEIFISSSSQDYERLNAIRDFSDLYDHGIDPHTAAAVVPWLRGDHDGVLDGDKQVVFLETSHVAQFSKELQDKGIIVPGMDEFNNTISAMEQFKPQEGKDYLRTTGEFEDAFKQIKNAISILTK